MTWRAYGYLLRILIIRKILATCARVRRCVGETIDPDGHRGCEVKTLLCASFSSPGVSLSLSRRPSICFASWLGFTIDCNSRIHPHANTPSSRSAKTSWSLIKAVFPNLKNKGRLQQTHRLQMDRRSLSSARSSVCDRRSLGDRHPAAAAAGVTSFEETGAQETAPFPQLKCDSKMTFQHLLRVCVCVRSLQSILGNWFRKPLMSAGRFMMSF